uniref:Uncharacterized protein n=1 Tax=Arundo donax TaxID=35708 RepID=A0A0A9DLA6_ARUDO
MLLGDQLLQHQTKRKLGLPVLVSPTTPYLCLAYLVLRCHTVKTVKSQGNKHLSTNPFICRSCLAFRLECGWFQLVLFW